MDEPETNIIPFPHPHRGDPEPRWEALAQIGFHWMGSAWRRRRVVLTDDAIDQMDTRTWALCLRRWTRPRPQRRPFTITNSQGDARPSLRKMAKPCLSGSTAPSSPWMSLFTTFDSDVEGF
jgi:hypothetical protein